MSHLLFVITMRILCTCRASRSANLPDLVAGLGQRTDGAFAPESAGSAGRFETEKLMPQDGETWVLLRSHYSAWRCAYSCRQDPVAGCSGGSTQRRPDPLLPYAGSQARARKDWFPKSVWKKEHACQSVNHITCRGLRSPRLQSKTLFSPVGSRAFLERAQLVILDVVSALCDSATSSNASSFCVARLYPASNVGQRELCLANGRRESRPCHATI